jgi:hypothetical protein
LPNNAGDFFKQTVVASVPFTVSVPGVTGRTYILWRNASLTNAAAWVGVVTNGPLVASVVVTLTDTNSPDVGAFYRTSVSLP